MEEIEKNSIRLHQRNVLLVMLAVVAVNLIQISFPLVAKAGTVSEHMYFEGASKSGDGYEWEYSDGSGTLTLNGATFEDGIEFKVPATIVLEEGTQNTIYGSVNIIHLTDTSYTAGILAYDELNFQGNGTLTVYSHKSGALDEYSGDVHEYISTYGLRTNNTAEKASVTIGTGSDNPILNFYALDAVYGPYSFGIYCINDNFIINSGTVTAVAGNDATNRSAGIEFDRYMSKTGEFVINGGTINITASDATGSSYGIMTSKPLEINGGDIVINTGNTTESGSKIGGCGSYGIYADDTTVEINGGQTWIKVGNVNAAYRLKKYTMYGEKGITISDDLKTENCAAVSSSSSDIITELEQADYEEYLIIKSKYHQITFDEEMQPNTVGFVIGSSLEMVENKEGSVKMESGTTVYMTVNDYPTEGYVVKNVELTDSEGKEIELTWDEDRREYKFTMPESDVMVKVEYKTYEFVANYSGIYDGQPHSITVENMPSDGTITYSEDEINYSATKPTYTDVVYQKIVYYKVDFKDGSRWSGSGLVTIKPADVSYIAPKAVTGLTYNGTSQNLIQPGTAENGTMYYRLGDAYTGTWSTAIPTATESGDYTIYYYVKADNDNYQDRGSRKSPIASINVTIAQKSLDTSEGEEVIAVQLDQKDNIYSYTGSEISPVVTVKDGDTTLKEGTDYTISGDTKEIQCGSYSLTVTGKGNYNGSIDVSWQIKDTTPPVISGVEEGEILCESKTITVTDDIAVDNVTVNGSEVVLSDEGTFTLSGVENTAYTIVATDTAGNEATVTVTIKKNDEEEAAKKDAEETAKKDAEETAKKETEEINKTTDVEVKENTPAVTVDGLENIFETVDNQEQSVITAEEEEILKNGGNVSVKLVAEAKDEKVDNASDIARQASKEKKTIGMYLDLSVIKQVIDVEGKEYSNGKLSELPSTIAIRIPLDSAQQGKENYVVYRYHGDKVDVIDSTVNDDGEYLELASGKTELILHVKKFSTYAVAYDRKSSGGTPLITTPFMGLEMWELPEEQEKTEEKKISGKQSDTESQEATSITVQEATEKNNASQDTFFATYSTIEAEKNDTDVKGSQYQKLQAKASKTTANSVKLTWNKVKGADGYLIYSNRCNSGGKKYSFKLIKTIKNGNTKSYTQKKLKKGTYYKYTVCAYKLVEGKKVNMSISKTVYATTTGNKYGNVKAVKLNKTKITLKAGKTFKLKAKELVEQTGKTKTSKKVKRYRATAYESSNEAVATVSGKGVIKAVKKGRCTIYVYAQNGVCKKVKVTVK